MKNIIGTIIGGITFGFVMVFLLGGETSFLNMFIGIGSGGLAKIVVDSLIEKYVGK